jgi:hypothetical protein
MDLRFIAPHLRRLDCASTEVLAAATLEDERPAHGVAGLIDWRLSGRVSRLMFEGFITGRLGEVLLLPGKPHMPFDKLLLFGAGARADFGERVYRDVLQKIFSTLEGLRSRSAVVELPGRHFGGIPAEQAAAVLMEIALDHPDHDVWTLVESVEAQRAITQQLAQERRRSLR